MSLKAPGKILQLLAIYLAPTQPYLEQLHGIDAFSSAIEYILNLPLIIVIFCTPVEKLMVIVSVFSTLLLACIFTFRIHFAYLS